MDIEEVKKIKKDDILNTTWGYGMTLNEYCRVIENNGKSIKCQKIGKKVLTEGMSERATPDKSHESCKPFRININKHEDNKVSLAGSYPSSEQDCKDKIRGYWRKWDGKPNYENTYD